MGKMNVPGQIRSGSERGKMKIAQLITRLDTGGTTRIVFSIISGLEKNRYDITLISGRSSNKAMVENFAGKNGVKVIWNDFLAREINPVKDLLCLWELYCIMKKNRFDIVQTHTSKAGFIGRIAAWLAGVPVIFHMTHGHVFSGYFGKIKTAFFICLEKIVSEFTDKIIVLSEQEKKVHLDLGIGPGRLEVVYNGIGVEYESVAPAHPGRRAGMIARLEPVKDHPTFLKALVRAKKILPDIRAVLAGGGSLRKDLEKQVDEMGLKQEVEFLGEIQDVKSLLATLNLVVLSSRNEGLGMCLLEAQSAGRPVVATRVGGIPEAVADCETGILVPPGDPDALCSAIVDLLTDYGKARRFGMAGRERVRKYFSAEKMLKRFDELYGQIYNEKIINYNSV